MRPSCLSVTLLLLYFSNFPDSIVIGVISIKDDVKIFESVFGSRDYFALLSSLNRNAYFDLSDDNKFILIGARFHLISSFIYVYNEILKKI
jgi:hypothetical protein